MSFQVELISINTMISQLTLLVKMFQNLSRMVYFSKFSKFLKIFIFEIELGLVSNSVIWWQGSCRKTFMSPILIKIWRDENKSEKVIFGCKSRSNYNWKCQTGELYSPDPSSKICRTGDSCWKGYYVVRSDWFWKNCSFFDANVESNVSQSRKTPQVMTPNSAKWFIFS